MKENNTKYKTYLPRILTLTGILIGLLLAILIAWPDYEASAYGFMRRAQTPFRGLICPAFLGKNERGIVSVKISNPTDRTISPGVWTEVSTSQELDSKIEYVQLAPGEHSMVQRAIGPENIDLGSFIFVDALVYSAYPMPDRENTCGILVLPVSSGTSILIFGTALSILLMTAGMFLLYKNELPARRPNSILFMVLAALLAMTFSFMGWWLLAIIVIVLLLLMLVITSGTLFG